MDYQFSKIDDRKVNWEKSFIESNNDRLMIQIIHSNDHLRIIRIFINPNTFYINTCYLQDNVLIRLKNSEFEDKYEFFDKYIEYILRGDFCKKMYYFRSKTLGCDYLFDDKNIIRQRYFQFHNRILSIILFPFIKTNKFRYLSFFNN